MCEGLVQCCTGFHSCLHIADAFNRLDTLITAAYGPNYMQSWFNYLAEPVAFGQWQIDFRAAILDASDQVRQHPNAKILLSSIVLINCRRRK